MNETLELKQIRYDSGEESTLSVLAIPAENKFICYICEDEARAVKVPGETRIPAGRYEILLREAGRMHPRYLDRFPQMHRGMLWLQDVPDFTWIYIHMGNDDDDSEGCLLPGTVPAPSLDGGGGVRSSRAAYVKLYIQVITAMDLDRRVFITIKDWA